MPQKTLVRLKCGECKNINYFTRRNKRDPQAKKLELSKYCRHCRKHTAHKEAKK